MKRMLFGGMLFFTSSIWMIALIHFALIGGYSDGILNSLYYSRNLAWFIFFLVIALIGLNICLKEIDVDILKKIKEDE